MRRILGIVLAVLLIGGVVAAIIAGGGGRKPDDTATKTVRGVIGSEKAEFFDDPEVRQALAAQGYDVKIETSGSWAMDKLPLADYDFAFPGSDEPAKEIAAKAGVKGAQSTTPFSSPLVVLARPPAAKALAGAGLASLTGPHTGVLRMEPFLKAAGEGATWQRITEGKAPPELAGALYVRTANPETSNSGALFAGAVGYVAAGGAMVADDAAVARVKPLVKRLNDAQGSQSDGSDEPFRALVSGGGEPLTLAYEAQVAALLAGPDGAKAGGTADGLVVLYPDTTVNAVHTFVPLKPGAAALGTLLTEDPKLRALALRHGFRPTRGAAEFAKAAAPFTAWLNPGLTGIRQVGSPTVPILKKLTARTDGVSP
ncbi:hypothetical protein ACN20G_08205 [Streptomyces sp. BI20]|uniref:hypothetical protein n=1 Tax=Streptomyces sp. BI20 TaxID=3403460 RepID=UPI003C777E55